MLTLKQLFPKITLVTRKAYGGSYLAMCSQDLGADQVIAWPTAEIAVMGPAGAANIIFRKDPDVEAKTKEYIDNFATPYQAAMRGMVDMVIEPKILVPPSSTLCKCWKANAKPVRQNATATFLCNSQAVA